MYCVGFFAIFRLRGKVVEKPETLKSIPRHFARYGISLDDFKEIFKNCLQCLKFVIIMVVIL